MQILQPPQFYHTDAYGSKGPYSSFTTFKSFQEPLVAGQQECSNLDDGDLVDERDAMLCSSLWDAILYTSAHCTCIVKQ